MANNILYAQNKIKLVNKCLEAIGQYPLEPETLIEDIQIGTDAYTAVSTIDETTLEVLNEGWHFNSDYNFRLVPDTLNMIALPPNVLRIDGGRYNTKGDITIKKSQVYSKLRQSFEFFSPIKVDIIWFVEYEDMPISAFNYIGAKAANKFQTKIIGDTTMFQMLSREEEEYHTYLLREKMQTNDYNIIPKDHR